ncbi:beta-1,3-glucan-binding protein-like [Schistocerca cancellata]|uniref:beta-1,3-glucan-binding protein-like n=1 Tax=Schistocerca cancellata TaxID=274614 RepID=UPI0021186A15|nr:beta-1,3-glucan-binding protein-like [Schistocerca cancellata]
MSRNAHALLVAVLVAAAASLPCGCLAQCTASQTTASGTKAPVTICSGDMIFADDFEDFDLSVWQHEITMSGGGNWEFQIYVNNRSNSFARDGYLNIRPTLTSDQYGEAFLSSGTIDLNGGSPADECTNPSFYGCSRTGTATNILNPVTSARLRTVNSFSFRYGRVEVRAKLPAGDWLWPAIWLLPRNNKYGGWPASGEIDLMESRGNLGLTVNNVNIGAEQVSSTLHFGPYYPVDAYQAASFSQNSAAGQGYDKDFHSYQLEWTPDYIKFSIDGTEIGTVTPTDEGFWAYGGFNTNVPTAENPWRYATKMAPFDQEYYIIINLAVGGTNGYFPDNAQNTGGNKPWINSSPTAFADFWNGRNSWLSTWNRDEGGSSSLQVDYVRVWAL